VNRHAIALGLSWLALVAAAPTPVPVELPLPDLTPLVAILPAPIDKPPVPLPDFAMPPPPELAPELPPPRLVLDPGISQPTAPIGDVDCDLLTRLTSALRCGKARFQAERYDEAIKAFERVSGEREARYWLGESFYRVDRISEADRVFVDVVRGARDELTTYARHGSGWTALRLGESARALDAFDTLLKPASGAPQPGVVSARRGRALALSLLGRHDDARQAWGVVLGAGPPPPLAREAAFWLGEAYGRLGQYAAADEQLTRFTRGGPHPLLGAALLRLGWWRSAAGRPEEAVKAFRDVLAAPVGASELELAYFGIAEASIAAGDLPSARDAIRSLEQRSSRLLRPALLAMARAAATKRQGDAHRVNQELLGRQLGASERAWVLTLEGELFRAEGKRDEARTRYDLARMADPTGGIGQYSRLRLGQLNFEFREFAQAREDVRPLLAQLAAGDLLAPALLLAGDAAYYDRAYDAAILEFRRFLVEFQSHPSAPAATLSVGWAELRRGREAEAQVIFADFARERPDSPLAPDALLLAAELSAGAGDVAAALEQLERMSARYPNHPQAALARLNRAILLLQSGRARDAMPWLRDYIAREADSPQIGPARAALGVAMLSARRFPEARQEFADARQAGTGALASLGLGVAATGLRQWDAAVEALREARETGPPAIGGAAEYGLAVVAFTRGQQDEFRKLAAARVAAGGASPPLLYALVTVGVEQKAWGDALEAAKRLVAAFASDATVDSALARLGLAAAAEKQWPIARDALSLLRASTPRSLFVDQSLLPWAEAQVETGGVAAARAPLEEFVKTATNDARLPRAWFFLARIREDTGDRAGAIEAYTRAARGPDWTPAVQLRFARLLVSERRWSEARTALDELMKSGDPATVTEAAFLQGQAHDADGNPATAVRYYMTAAYVAPESPFGRRALLAAGASYIALKQPDNAAIAYNKLLAQANLPPDLAQRAREELAKLGAR
jgi:TolA-binding protein